MDDHPSDERRALLVKDLYAYDDDDDDSERLVASSSSSSSNRSKKSEILSSSNKTAFITRLARTKSLLAIVGVAGMVACAYGGKAAGLKTLLLFGAGQRGDAVRVFVFFPSSNHSFDVSYTAASFFWTFIVFFVFDTQRRQRRRQQRKRTTRRDHHHHRFCSSSSSSLSSFVRSSSLSKSFPRQKSSPLSLFEKR